MSDDDGPQTVSDILFDAFQRGDVRGAVEVFARREDERERVVRWEYHTMSIVSVMLKETLADLGRQGWELVLATDELFVFKRRLG
jgi:hypothetical protein